ncbi:MAG: hypothetical protein BroJett030_28590 [Alphaproteobacteria bacterium]|nr:MAG: hypothetical protein BroJett030_28590 [Alphaproteobacteria bacterium]
MNWARYGLAVALTMWLADQAGAIVTSNVGGKSTVDKELAQVISVRSSGAAQQIWTAINEIETSHDLAMGADYVKVALASLSEIVGLLDQAIKGASTTTLTIGDPAQIQLEPKLAESAGSVNAADVMEYLKQRIRPWPPSERATLEFLQAETRFAVGAIEMMQAGQLGGNEDMVRFGVLTFTRYQYAVTAFSVLWALVVS